MKTRSLLCLAFLALPSISFGGFSLPKGVYTVDALADARSEAIEEGKGLAFVMSDKKTDCPLCVGASEEAFKELKSHSVVVYIDSENLAKDYQAVSPMVVSGLNQKTSGMTIPKISITSPDMDQLWAHMSYKDIGDGGKFRETKKRIQEIVAGTAQPTPAQGFTLHWPVKNSAKFFVGTFQSMNDKQLVLIMDETKKPAGIKLDRLSDQSIAFARKMAGQQAGEQPKESETVPKAEFEPWTGSNGKVLQAKLVGLAGDRITLQTQDGKEHILPLDRLDEASQEKAKTQAATLGLP